MTKTLRWEKSCLSSLFSLLSSLAVFTAPLPFSPCRSGLNNQGGTTTIQTPTPESLCSAGSFKPWEGNNEVEPLPAAILDWRAEGRKNSLSESGVVQEWRPCVFVTEIPLAPSVRACVCVCVRVPVCVKELKKFYVRVVCISTYPSITSKEVDALQWNTLFSNVTRRCRMVIPRSSLKTSPDL